jgi:hypothetical protein
MRLWIVISVGSDFLKVGILTYHDGFNHGAFLQAFSMQKVLESCGHHVCVINYKNKVHARKEGWRQLIKYRRPRRFLDFFEKRTAFHQAHSQFNLSSYTTDPEEVDRLGLDAVVVGSDVVWNYKIFGYDDLYFGGVKATKRIAYAPSFGWIGGDDPGIEETTAGLRRFDHISARDENTQRIAERVTGIQPPKVLDPTFLIDFAPYEQMTERIRRLPPFLLVYAHSITDDHVAQVMAFAKKEGLICLATGYRQPWCDKNCIGVGPFEWLALYRAARFVVTSTFHGTIFSVKYEKPFVVSMNEMAKIRVGSLLKTLQLPNCVLPFGLDGEYFDYTKCREVLSKEVLFSREWITRAINGQ